MNSFGYYRKHFSGQMTISKINSNQLIAIVESFYLLNYLLKYNKS
jgi:hypothetical protein